MKDVFFVALGIGLGWFNGCNYRTVTPKEFSEISKKCDKNEGLHYFNKKTIYCKDGARFWNPTDF